MLRLASSACPFCEARAVAPLFHQPWQQSTRSAATLQKRRPSRMTLSSNVKRDPAPSPTSTPYKAAPKNRGNPFGGMNVTEAPRSLTFARNRNERKRTSTPQKAVGSRNRKDKGRDPMHALKMQRALANVSYEKRGRVKESIMERDRFDEFDLLPSIKESIASQALGGMVDVSPTPIQRLALPALLGTEDGKRRRKRGGKPQQMEKFLLAAETGSGKTLAYVLPIIDAIKRAEAAEAEAEAREAARDEQASKAKSANKLFHIEPPTADEPDPYTARPRAIILVPTSELVEQVGHLVKSLSHTVKFRASLLSSTYTGQVIRSRLFSKSGIDVVISTPHLLHSITESDPNVLSRATHLVVDEADSLLDRSFAPTTSALIDRAAPSLHQLIFCSATIPRSLDNYMQKRYPDIRRLVTPNLHAIPRRVQLSVVDIEKIPYQGNRDLACAQVIWDIGQEAAEGETHEKDKKILVFVNQREKTVELATYLRSKGISATALSRDAEDRKGSEILASFTGTSTTPPREHHKKQQQQRHLPNTTVLITTDLTSRGIDTLPLRHVLLYDVPHTTLDFIHRLGRVGRRGRRGRGVVLVGRNDRRDVVREVREGMFRGKALI